MRVQREQEVESQRVQLEESGKSYAALKELNQQLQRKAGDSVQQLQIKSGELQQSQYKLREVQEENERLKTRLQSAAASSRSSLRSSATSSNMQEEELQLYKVLCLSLSLFRL